MARADMPKSRLLDPDHWWDVVVASDPGLDRLRTAARATLTAGASLLTLHFLAQWLGRSGNVYLVGVAVAMMGTVLIQGASRRSQMITTALLVIPATATIALGSALSGMAVWDSVAFVAVIFVAIWVRRFGPRATALGMMGFWGYLYALFFHAPLSKLPWIAASLVVATAVAMFVRFVLLRERGARHLENTRNAYLARARMLLRQLVDATRAGEWHRLQRTVLANLARLDETALGLRQSVQSSGQQTSIDPALSADELRAQIFAVELATQRVAAMTRRLLAADVAPEVRQKMADALMATRRHLHAAAHDDADEPDTANTALKHLARRHDLEQLRRMAVSLEDLEAASDTRQRSAPGARALAASRAFTATDDDATDDSNNRDSDGDKDSSSHLRASTRNAIQAALAGGLAMLGGRWLSSSRWYWAVIASVVIFTRTSSRGETLVKGWRRMLGTVVGIGAGLGVAWLVAGHRAAEFVLIFAGLFAGFYLFQISYTWMVAGITMVLALLYSLLGRSVSAMMLTRLEETLLGVAIGALIAALVLPTDTHAKVRATMASVLRQLCSFLEQVAARLRGADKFQHPISVHTLDQTLQQMRSQAEPLAGRMIPVGFNALRYELLMVSALVYYARNLAEVAEHAGQDLGEEASRTTADALVALAVNLGHLAEAIAQTERPHQIHFQPVSANLDRAEQALPERRAGRAEPERRLSAGAIALVAIRAADELSIELCRQIAKTPKA